MSSAQNRPTRLPKQPLPTLSKHTEVEPPPAPKAADAKPDEGPLKIRRRGINRLLADIYGKPHFLSAVLRSGGISQADINQIYEEWLPDFLDAILVVWRVAFAGELTTGGWYILTRSYGLDGAPPTSVRYLAQALSISEQRVIEIRDLTLRVLRTPISRSHLESLTVTVASQRPWSTQTTCSPNENQP